MRIGLDARSIGNRICGVSRVASCLIHALSQIDKDNEYIVYTNSVIPNLTAARNFQFKLIYCSKDNPIHDIKFYSILKRDRLSLYHALYSWLPKFIPQDIKTVVSIHDLFAVLDSQFFVKYKPFHKLFQLHFKYLIKRSAKKADAIVTGSHYCKNEIINHYQLSGGKINVIYNAMGINNRSINLVNFNNFIGGNYLLYVGNCRSYKNVEILVHAFFIFINNNKSNKIKLVIAGNDTCNKIRSMVREFGIIEQIVFITNPSDKEICTLYRHASAFILPSKQEGFGIPVLEAMSFGVPVIISNANALVEIAGGAALIFKRDRPEELVSAIEKILSDVVLRETLIEKGYNRVKEFTWKSSALKLKSLYDNLLRI